VDLEALGWVRGLVGVVGAVGVGGDGEAPVAGAGPIVTCAAPVEQSGLVTLTNLGPEAFVATLTVTVREAPWSATFASSPTVTPLPAVTFALSSMFAPLTVIEIAFPASRVAGSTESTRTIVEWHCHQNCPNEMTIRRQEQLSML
jgi:hypothetical protein